MVIKLKTFSSSIYRFQHVFSLVTYFRDTLDKGLLVLRIKYNCLPIFINSKELNGLLLEIVMLETPNLAKRVS